ncbi:Protein kinase, putative [Hondaea fermentalgiana]|uniref:Protein kinase, putative n=1 Tax=Hondaea fermentalgiana TaxID=2315210 RepID=A0A2R5GTF2_9STRA|nr:Protein kinase, putative [Hondaea fermentalgiana]|eukprot:GBG34146.1 Protein kinase, putative [Hondaea fermentalgiana]
MSTSGRRTRASSAAPLSRAGSSGSSTSVQGIDAISIKTLAKLAHDLEQSKFEIKLFTVESDILDSEPGDTGPGDILIEQGTTVRLQSDGYIAANGTRIRPRPSQLREKPYFSWTLSDVLVHVLPDARISRGLFSKRHDSTTVHCMVAGPCAFADFARHMQVFMRSRKYTGLYLDFAAALCAEGANSSSQASHRQASSQPPPPPNSVALCFIDSWTYSWELRRDEPTHAIFGVGLQRPVRVPVDDVTHAEASDILRAVNQTGQTLQNKLTTLSCLLEEPALSDLMAKGISGNKDIAHLRSPVAVLRDVLHRRAALNHGAEAFPEAIVLHLELANALMDLRQKDAAMEHCEMALANSIECHSVQSTQHARTLMLVGVFDVDRGDLPRAQALFESALDICHKCQDDPDHELEAEILHQMSAIKFVKDDLGAAKGFLEDAQAALDANQSDSEPGAASPTGGNLVASSGTNPAKVSQGGPTANTMTADKENAGSVHTTVMHVAHENLRSRPHKKRETSGSVGSIRDDITHNLNIINHRMSSGDALAGTFANANSFGEGRKGARARARGGQDTAGDAARGEEKRAENAAAADPGAQHADQNSGQDRDRSEEATNARSVTTTTATPTPTAATATAAAKGDAQAGDEGETLLPPAVVLSAPVVVDTAAGERKVRGGASEESFSKASETASSAAFPHILSQAQLGPVIPKDPLLSNDVNVGTLTVMGPSPSCPNFGSLEAAHKRVFDSGLTFSEAKGQLWNLRKTGYLMKRGFRYRKLWSRRYIVLSGRMLKYFDQPPRDDIAASSPRGRLELTKHTIIRCSTDADDGPFGFQVLSLEAQIRHNLVTDPAKAMAVAKRAKEKEAAALAAAPESSTHGGSNGGGWNLGSWLRGGDDLDSSSHQEKNRNTRSIWRFQATSEKERKSWMNSLQRAVNLIRRVEVAPTLSGVGSVHYHYQMGDIIGSGRFGDVYGAVATMTGREYAIKVVDKEKRVKTKEAAVLLRNEIKAMRRVTRELDHSNICKLFQAYEDPYMVYLVLEKLDGGDLFEHIAECVPSEAYTEAYAADMIRQIACALKELHSANVVLCDLRPENLLFINESSDTLKVTEFGRAVVLGGDKNRGARAQGSSESLHHANRPASGDPRADRNAARDADATARPNSAGSAAGNEAAVPRGQAAAAATYTQGVNKSGASAKRDSARRSALRRLPLGGMSPYMAPEVASFGKPSRSSDIWALGCIFFALLVGHPPFGGKAPAEMLKSISQGLQADKLNKDEWAGISGPAKVLLFSMLQVDPSKRLTAAQVLDHEWVKNPVADSCLETAHNRIQAYQAQRKAAPTHRPRLRSSTPSAHSSRRDASSFFNIPDRDMSASRASSFVSSTTPTSISSRQTAPVLAGAPHPSPRLQPERSAEFLALDLRAEKIRAQFGAPHKASIRNPSELENSQATFAPPGRFLNDLEGQMRIVREMEQARLRDSSNNDISAASSFSSRSQTMSPSPTAATPVATPGNEDVAAAVKPAPKGRPLVRILQQIVDECGMQMKTISNGWICIIEDENKQKRCVVTGCAFPLNSQSSANLALDKVSAAAVFTDAGVPHVPHTLVFGPTVQYTMASKRRASEGTIAPLMKMLQEHTSGLVLKPKDGNSGRNVILAQTPLEVEAGWLQLLRGGARDFAICPFFHLDKEWRLMVLDQELYVCYCKLRHGTEWRHNVSLGATTSVEVEKDLIDGSLLPLAKQAMSALGLRFASIDIVQLDLDKASDTEKTYANSSGFMVMEINSAVFVDGFLRQHPDSFPACLDMFRNAVTKSIS